MGFFSSLCEGCHHPLLSPMAVDATNAWMSHGVAIGPGGSITAGVYDGYGRFTDPVTEAQCGPALEQATVWHRACWREAGEPLDYRGESPYAPDQGWFFEDGAHDLPEPGVASSP